MNEVEEIEMVKLDRCFDGLGRGCHACLFSLDNMTAEGLSFYDTRRTIDARYGDEDSALALKLLFSSRLVICRLFS